MLQDITKSLRTERKISQTALARKLHVTQGAVSQWETGATRPDTEQLLAMAECFGVTVDALFGIEKDNESISSSIELKNADDNHTGLSVEEKNALDHFVWLLKESGDRSVVEHAIWTVNSLYDQAKK